MRELLRNDIGANQFAIRSVLADMEEKRGEETMNTCDLAGARSVCCIAQTKLYAKVVDLPSEILGCRRNRI